MVAPHGKLHSRHRRRRSGVFVARRGVRLAADGVVRAAGQDLFRHGPADPRQRKTDDARGADERAANPVNGIAQLILWRAKTQNGLDAHDDGRAAQNMIRNRK